MISLSVSIKSLPRLVSTNAVRRVEEAPLKDLASVTFDQVEAQMDRLLEPDTDSASLHLRWERQQWAVSDLDLEQPGRAWPQLDELRVLIGPGRFCESHGRGDDHDRALVRPDQLPLALVNLPVMPAAQEDLVVEIAGAALQPVHDVVTVAPRGGPVATRPLAVLVASD